ncbi:hypothetical protein PSA7680_00340 [Pseudoruegeria aquimaris]|uniref:DUF2155 domain-containing protein n=1 Tax=Pseudoruegeria aquimaris TaxID=393663 RepID=A0A1Y5RCV5_9RHOB|nr:DUF2155 domain-containing protein [Pseudoruegeria aquimaris]SLN14482.1 hypothetical protein PSA7680_00340 [Pseudoruegeria aquimaris]
MTSRRRPHALLALTLAASLAAGTAVAQTFGLLPEEQPGANPNGEIVERTLEEQSDGLSLIIDDTIRLIEIDDREKAETAPGGVLRALDKVDGALQDLALENGGGASFGRIDVVLDECRVPADNPTGDAYAHVTIHDQVLDKTVFEGWMIASSPALNALDHPRYDVWLLRCGPAAQPETDTASGD